MKKAITTVCGVINSNKSFSSISEKLVTLRLFLLNTKIRCKQNWRFCHLKEKKSLSLKIRTLTELSKSQKQPSKQKIYLFGAQYKTIISCSDRKNNCFKRIPSLYCAVKPPNSGHLKEQKYLE